MQKTKIQVIIIYICIKQLGSEAAKRDLEAKTQRSEEAKSVSDAAKCNILLSPLEGEKKFLSELCELRNFREGYKKYKTLDRATGCAMTDVGDKKGKIKMNENNLQQKQPNNLTTFLETNHSPLTIHHSLKRKTAFTLAEVLITLGIIGVVAALTLPSVINKYKAKQLETAFKKSSATVMTALNNTAVEMGYNNYNDLIACASVSENEVQNCVISNQEFIKDVNNVFEANLITINKMTLNDIINNKFDIPISTYNGAKKIGYRNMYGIRQTGNTLFILNDGSIVTSIDFYKHNPKEIDISFDTNGIKGPNRWGYDVFTFTTAWNLMCGKKGTSGGYSINSEYNGRGCYNYALKDVNPDDKTKGYWKSLYK